MFLLQTYAWEGSRGVMICLDLVWPKHCLVTFLLRGLVNYNGTGRITSVLLQFSRIRVEVATCAWLLM